MVENAPDPIDATSFLSRLFSNPIFGIAASLASVLGLILSIYFYVQSTRKRDLVYLVNPVQAVVVKTGEATNLHVLYGDRELKSDVTAAQIALWNQGNESIRPENILEQVEPNCPRSPDFGSQHSEKESGGDRCLLGSIAPRRRDRRRKVEYS
jgi:hypothetical protein